MKNYIFRQYDIRGIVDVEFTYADMYIIAHACAYYLHTKGVTHVAVGRDGRVHSLGIHEQLIKAFKEVGFSITDIGCCTTPLVYFAASASSIQAGIMITASHNSAQYNGLKIVINGHSITAEQVEEIKLLALEAKRLPELQNAGNYKNVSMLDAYITLLMQDFAHLKNSTISFVVDCSNGVGSLILKPLCARMGWENAILLFSDLDGTFPHHDPDPTVRENMHEVYSYLKQSTAVIGFGLDGDADRLAVMTKSGELVEGDKLLALFARSLSNSTTNFTVVGDAKSSFILPRLLKQWGNTFVMAPCGHANIKRAMYEHNALLGGELSGHFIFNDRFLGFDDGIYALCRVLEIVSRSQNAEWLFDFYPHSIATPELRIEIPEEEKYLCIDAVKQLLATFPPDNCELAVVDGIRITTPEGWFLLRAAHTQPALSVRFEAESPDAIMHLKQLFYSIIKQAIPKYFQYIHDKIEPL